MAVVPSGQSLPSILPQPSPLDKNELIKTANFAKIPSTLSLKSKNVSSSAISPQLHQGRVENVHLVSLSKQGKLREAQEFLKEMDIAGVSVTPYSYQCLLESCAESRCLSEGKSIHDHLQRMLADPPVFVENCVLQMYCDCGNIMDAQRVFDKMREKNMASWVILVSAYTKDGNIVKAIKLFSSMDVEGIRPNSTIYISLLVSLANSSKLKLGEQIHAHVTKAGFTGHASLDTAILNMYVKCGCLESAELAFNQMVEKSVVSWTGLMVGYMQVEKKETVLELFVTMLKAGVQPDDFVFSITLKACAGLEGMVMGRQVHGYIVKLGMEDQVSVGTPLVDFYVKCRSLDSALRAFDKISEPNDVSWSALISGYSQNFEFEECLKIFKSLNGRGEVLNSFLYTNIFQACAAVAAFSLGAQVHGDAIKRGMISYLYGESAMITMYAKCGRLDYAYKVFETMERPDNVAWTAMIAGCAYHGNASEALVLFRRMVSQKVKPNAITFIAVLTACSHSGFIKEAEQYLYSMSSEYGVDPTIDHYDCMIDIYARGGLLDEAFQLIKTMPFEPDAMSWKSLLGGCSIHKNFKLGKIAAENLLQLDPQDTAAYILMFNLHALAGEWEEAGHIRKLMAERGLRKEVSCSWITVKGKMHRFVVGDKHHPKTEEIYAKLKEFNEFPKSSYNKVLLSEDDESYSLPERKEQLLDHSERLAIAFGLITCHNNAPITIFKNLRACRDCHDFAKYVSKVTGREIVVRDANRFHHFKSGDCSCGDYW